MNKVTSLCAMVRMPKVVVYPQHDIVGLLLYPELWGSPNLVLILIAMLSVSEVLGKPSFNQVLRETN